MEDPAIDAWMIIRLPDGLKRQIKVKGVSSSSASVTVKNVVFDATGSTVDGATTTKDGNTAGTNNGNHNNTTAPSKDSATTPKPSSATTTKTDTAAS